MRITGTFIDEITFDIPPHNWGREDWAKEFQVFKDIGIDTVIIIRGGYKRRSVFPSKVVGDSYAPDLAQIFLDEAQRHGINLFFGIFDSGLFGLQKWDDWKEELVINRRFIDEVQERYGDHPAFHGWYISHETSILIAGIREFYDNISAYMKETTPQKPVLISPYYSSGVVHQESNMVRTMEQFADEWRLILSESAAVDICAFQDGTAPLDKLPNYMAAIKEVCKETGKAFWNNTESFSRDFPIKFPPTDYRTLFEKLRVTSPFVEKQITFEFSHFLSPNSIWPAARNLFERYRETYLQD